MSEDGPPQETDLEIAVASVDELVEFMRRAEKPPERWRVGTEHEKIGLYERGPSPVPYEGERGIGALLDAIADSDGWSRILEDGNVIALAKDGASIRAIAGCSPSVAVSSASETVGRPSPMTPLTVPASRKVTATTRSVVGSINGLFRLCGCGMKRRTSRRSQHSRGGSATASRPASNPAGHRAGE